MLLYVVFPVFGLADVRRLHAPAPASASPHNALTK